MILLLASSTEINDMPNSKKHAFFRAWGTNRYKSVSAFAPICNPTACPWGEKAFSGYLADPATEAKEYDACTKQGKIFVDSSGFPRCLLLTASARRYHVKMHGYGHAQFVTERKCEAIVIYLVYSNTHRRRAAEGREKASEPVEVRPGDGG